MYRPALVAELRDRPYEFDIQVQLCADLALMPVEDVTVEWPEALSPFVTVAKLRIPRQDISGGDNLEKMDALSFTPWRVTPEHVPLGNIMRARKEIYRHSSILRHKLNKQQRTEPCSADEVLTVKGKVFRAGGDRYTLRPSPPNRGVQDWHSATDTVATLP